jgi:hypothetical protein
MWGTNWIDLAQNRDSCRAVANAVMNLRVLYNAGSVPFYARLDYNSNLKLKRVGG